MHIKPTGWQFTVADFCCQEFRNHALAGGIQDYTINKSGTSVILRDSAITYCPFCGKKIVLKKVLI